MAAVRHLENRKTVTSHDDEELQGLSSVSVVGHLGFLKLKFLTGGALERHVSHHLSHFEEIDHTVAAIAIFRMKCKNSLDDRA